jgi:hypothetical protein
MSAVLKIISTYDDLVEGVRERCDEMSMTRAELDHQAGLADGHAGKLLCPAHLKRFGIRSLGFVLGGIGCKLALIDDPDQAAKIRARMKPRERPIKARALPSPAEKFLQRKGPA